MTVKTTDRGFMCVGRQTTAADPARAADPIPEPDTRRGLEVMAGRRGVRRDFYVVHHVPVGLDGQDYFAAYRARNRGFRCYIGFTMFETDRLPPGWAEACNGMDEIWVPSPFNRETFSRSGVDPEMIQIIPLGIDPGPFRDPVHPWPIPGARGFTFLSVFQWTKRKGGDLLIRAFLEAFEAHEEVCLVIRSFGLRGESVEGTVLDLIRDAGRDPREVPRIVLLDEPVADRDMPALYAAADAFVLPSRGEGWGLPYLEAMASGLPVIGTDWSGNTAFMHAGNSYLVPVKGLVKVHDEEVAELPFYKGHRYAEPDFERLKGCMREVFEDRERAGGVGAAARKEALDRWTRQGAVEAMMKRFRAWRARWDEAARTRNPPLPKIRWAGDPAGGDGAALRAALSQEPGVRLEMNRDPGADEGEPCIHLCHGDPLAHPPRAGGALRVARVAFPLDGLPEGWAHVLNGMDEIWVPSAFHEGSFARAGVDPDKLVTLPEPVDAWRFGPHVKGRDLDGPDRFVFLSVFPWSLRKGWDHLVEAFCREFGPDEPVTLFLKTLTPPPEGASSIEEELPAFIRNRLGRSPSRCPKIVVCRRGLAEDEMPGLYRGARAFVLPTRGEGFGRAVLEAMASALPVIITDLPGRRSFVHEDNAMLVPFETVPVPEQGLRENPAYAGLDWAEPSLPDLRRAMREIFENPGPGRDLGERAREETAERHSPERCARRVLERIEILAGRSGSRGSPASSRDPGTSQGRNVPRMVMEGAFSALSSTAFVNRQVVRALVRGRRVALATRPLEGDPPFSGSDGAAFAELDALRGRRFDRPAQVHVWHQWPPCEAAPPADRWVVWQGWEYGSLPRRIFSLLRSGPDEVWTYSSYCAREFLADGLPAEKVQVIPLGVDGGLFRPDAPVPDRLKGLARKKTVFLFVGGTIWRKGIDLLLSAYCRAFTRDDDVALVVKEMGSDTFYRDYNLTEAVERLAAHPMAPEITLFRDPLEDREMPGLYRACTCLVHPYRGEGFGLPVLEAMACGLPVIVTAGGACDAFALQGGARFVRARRREIPLPLETVRPAWVLEPDVDHLAVCMREVADDPSRARERGIAGSGSIRAEWTWDRTADAVADRCAVLKGR